MLFLYIINERFLGGFYMEYYKSKNPDERLEEAMENLRRQLAKEYRTHNRGFEENTRQITKNNVKMVMKKTNLPEKLISPSEHSYKMSQLARINDDIRTKNDHILEGDVRMQLAEDIVTREGITTEVAILALEVLLREPGAIPEYSLNGRESFLQGINKAETGIRKLMRTNKSAYDNLRRKNEELREELER